ncbi:MAG TPA: GNAT family N-acetyltransferase, partial [Chitinophagaceae bacterium]
EDVMIRTELRSGDLGYVIYLHGKLYKMENDYGLAFEAYVAAGLAEFYQQYKPEVERVWICEFDQRIIGFMLLMKRGEYAQLRFFVLEPEFRGIGLGNRLLRSFLDFMSEAGYSKAYLWTTNELPASAHLYRKFGFKVTEEHPSTSWGKAVVEQRYELHLGK